MKIQMLNNHYKEKLEKLKKKLNNLIKNNASYEDTLKTSQELDKYITMYYKNILNRRI